MVQVLIFVYVRLNFIIVCTVIFAAGSVVVGRARNMKFGKNNLDLKQQPRNSAVYFDSSKVFNMKKSNYLTL